MATLTVNELIDKEHSNHESKIIIGVRNDPVVITPTEEELKEMQSMAEEIIAYLEGTQSIIENK